MERLTGLTTNPDKKLQAQNLFEKRSTYKYAKTPDLVEDQKQLYSFSDKVVSFSLADSWRSLVQTKCKPWDDRELDAIEGIKFFSYFLGQLCLTAEFLMCTQTLNPWMITRFFQEWIFTIVISSNIVMEAFTALSAFLGAYKLFSLYKA